MSFFIGNIEIKQPVLLAPMKGVTDLPFRKLVKRYGAGLVFSEMLVNRSTIRKPLPTENNYSEETPIAVQLAGCEPELLAEAARINADKGADIIDLNFGCPIKKIVNKYAGSALMKDETLSAQIMEATVNAASVPVTVKMRLGWDNENKNAASLAKIAENCGIKMITVHGRTRDQLFNGTADWEAIRSIKEAVNIPVIVNGDITTPRKASEAIKLSGADGVMIGRGAYGKPWLLRQIIDYLNNSTITADPELNEIENIILEHYDMILEYYGENKGIGIARKHFSWYLASMPNSEEVYTEIRTLTDPSAVINKLKNYFELISKQNN